MKTLTFLLFLVTLIILAVGAMSPAALTKLYGYEPSRRRILLVYGGAMLIFFFLFTVAAGPPEPVAREGLEREYAVTRVIDGDTFEIDDSGQTERVRLIGIDAPEVAHPGRLGECFGQEATERARELIEGERLLLKPDSTQGDRDSYGRLLRYAILADGTDFSLTMIAEGYAYEYTHIRPYRHQEEYRAAALVARDQGKGLWAKETCDGQRELPVAPGPDLAVKLSNAGICHAPGTTYYEITINFTPYRTLQDCLDTGGRLPAR